jgi:Flp pilus assembly protein TadG
MTKNGHVLKGFLGRLLKSQAGNTLAMIAAGVFPLLGLMGGGIDMSRLYLTKARLQLACDSGALAGRKMMGGGAWNANSNKANTTAENMFNANFVNNAYGTNSLTKSFSESAGTVSGTASVVVPMMIMKVFGFANKTISVTCSAEMRIPNTDVMFVLDTTGSMDQNDSTGTKKITGLRKAVKCFYETLAKIDIDDVDCGSTPSGGNSSLVQLRFGFVPYSTNVNVGTSVNTTRGTSPILSNAWMSNSWTYQSREAVRYNTNTGTQSVSEETRNNVSSSTCNSLSQGNTVISGPVTGDPPQSFTLIMDYYSAKSYDSWSRKCVRYVTRVTKDWTKNASGTNILWNYKPVEFDVSALKAGGSSWNTSVSLPIGSGGNNTSITWDGCIEERQTWRNSDGNPSDEYDPADASAYDLNIDMVPTSGDIPTQWHPALKDAIIGRVNDNGDRSYANVLSVNDMDPNYSYACPRPMSKLATYTTSARATTFKNYVNWLTPSGNTYHDIGMMWGARLLSPTGLFASDNAFTSTGGVIQRHLIFMTDGDTQTSKQNYAYQGVAFWDRRQTRTDTVPTDTSDFGSTDTSLMTTTVNARTLGICNAIKNKNITLWVISFGSGVSDDAKTLLQTCASPGRFFDAADSDDLISNFKSIADKISQLRLTQ